MPGSATVTTTSEGDGQTNESQHTGPCNNLPLSPTMSGRKWTSVLLPSPTTPWYGLLIPADGWQTAETAGGMQKQPYTPKTPYSALTRRGSWQKICHSLFFTKHCLKGQNDTAFWQPWSNIPYQYHNEVHAHEMFQQFPWLLEQRIDYVMLPSTKKFR